MSEVGDATQIIVVFGKGGYLLGKITLKAALQFAKLINTIWLSKWKGKTIPSRLRAIKGEDMMYINAGTEDKHSLKLIEKEMKKHGILFIKMPDLCGGDGRTQYAMSVSDAPKVRALLINHATGPNKDIYLGMMSEKDYLSTAFTRNGTLTPETQKLMSGRGQPQQSQEQSYSAEYGSPQIQRAELQNAFQDVKVRLHDLDCQGLQQQYQWIAGRPLEVMKNFAEYSIDQNRTVFIPIKDALLPGENLSERSLGAALFHDRAYTVTDLQTGTFKTLAGPVVMAMVKEAAQTRTAGQQTVGTREISKDLSKTAETGKVPNGMEGPVSALENLSSMLHGGSSQDLSSPFEKKL